MKLAQPGACKLKVKKQYNYYIFYPEREMVMKTVEESVVITAMDGGDAALFEFLPYLLQDSWELGSDPEKIIRVLKSVSGEYSGKRILDLGCGKGVVSILLAKELGCTCHGIDAVPGFISYAEEKAKEYEVVGLCKFEVGDIRTCLQYLPKYDVVILGAIGPVLGTPYEAMMQLKDHLTSGGMILFDDGYIEDGSSYQHDLVSRKSDLFRQIKDAGMEIVAEYPEGLDASAGEADSITLNLIARCKELMEQYPEKKKLSEDYIKKQEAEIDAMKHEIVCSTIVIKKSNLGDE